MTETDKVIKAWVERNEFRLQRFVLFRAIRSLPEVEALALIRAAFAEEDGTWAGLTDARVILTLLQQGRGEWAQ